MIDFGLQKRSKTRDVDFKLLEFVDDVVDELGSREHINYTSNIKEWNRSS
jgi:carboxylate-amine ligase